MPNWGRAFARWLDDRLIVNRVRKLGHGFPLVSKRVKSLVGSRPPRFVYFQDSPVRVEQLSTNQPIKYLAPIVPQPAARRREPVHILTPGFVNRIGGKDRPE